MQTTDLLVTGSECVNTTTGATDSKPRYSEPQTQNTMNYSFTFDQHLASSKSSPTKVIQANKKSVTSNTSQTNPAHSKRTKGPLNHIKARLNLNTGADKRIAKSHVFKSTSVNSTGSAPNQTAPTGAPAAPPCDRGAGGSGQATDPVPNCRHIPINARDRALVSNGQPCIEHSFISDLTDVRKMENTLLTLLEDFHSGKLRAFGQDITFEKMESVREQQERLARLHFDLDVQQEVYGHQTEEGKRMAKDNMTKLIENLQQLSDSIEQLQSKSSVVNTSP